MNWIKTTFTNYGVTILITALIIIILESISSIAFYQLTRPNNYAFSSTIETIQRMINQQGEQSQYRKLIQINTNSQTKDRLYPSYLYDSQLHHPRDFYFLANVANSKIIGCNESGDFNYWQTDQFGFRNPTETHKSKSDILLIGDSFTEGACENETGTIAGYLRSSGSKVANLGRGGSGPLFQLATLVEYAPNFESEKVVWIIFTGNDLRNLREEKTTRLSGYLDESYSQRLVENRSQVDRNLRQFLYKQISNSNIRMKKRLPLISTSNYGESLDLLDAKSHEALLLTEVSARILTEVKKMNAELKVVILNHIDYSPEIQELTSTVIKEFAVSNEVDYFEISREYLLKNKDMYNTSGPHFNKDGYRTVGKEIRAWLEIGGNKNL